MARLKIDSLYKMFPATRANPPTRALNGISFEAKGDQFVSVVGPSGCGKSTLLNIVSQIETPSAGSVEVVDDDGRPAKLGYVFQQPRLLPWRTVMENLLYVHDDASEHLRERLLAELDAVGLRAHGDYYPGQLSGGMQQRVGIARAFSVSPDLLLMDEPFSHLDAITARELRAQLQQVWGEKKTTVLFVTHDVVEAVELSDRIIVLEPGGVMHEDISVSLPRPRDPFDPDVVTMQAKVLGRLEFMSNPDAESAVE